MKIRLDQIKRDEKLSPRIEQGTVASIAQDYADCFDQLPPLTVFKIDGESKYLLADGWHRYRAAEILGLTEVECDVRYGARNDALEFAMLSNLRHGLPLTRNEKHHVIEEFLILHSGRSNQWIAEDLGTTTATVSNIRTKLEQGFKLKPLTMLIGRDGIERPRTIEQPKLPGPAEEEGAEETESEEDPDLSVVPMLGPYELNQAHNLDCLVGLANLPDSCVDLIFADPPYNLGIDYGEGVNDSLPTETYFQWCVQWFAGCYRILRPGGALYVMHYPEVVARWKQSLDGFLTFRRWLSWVYPSNIGHSNGNWRRSHRAILYYTKGTPAYFNGEADPQPYKNPDDLRVMHLGKEGTTPYDWWEFNLVKNVSKDKTSWPNQLPKELLMRVILSSCPAGGIVCDPFLGSGTTAEAAVMTGRQWIGFDKEQAACELTGQRISQYVPYGSNQELLFSPE